MAETLRKYAERRLSDLKAMRQDYEDEYRDISKFAQPARSRFLNKKSDKQTHRRYRNAKLRDSRGIEAFRTLGNGMTSGLSSPSRPWFMLRLPDDDLNDQPGVRAYLAEVERRMYGFLASTNFYGAAKAGYAELGLFGTEACVMVEHPVQGAVCHNLTAGEYWVGMGDALTPDTLIRQSWMSVRQVVQTFGREAPGRIMRAHRANDKERQVQVYNLIEPNPSFKEDQLGSKPWSSVYWCDDCEADEVLAIRGYDEQPFWAPRWDVVGSDTYGISPGMEALPALRELQMQVKRRNEAVDKLVKPEVAVPQNMRLTGQPGNKVSSSGVSRDQVFVPDPIDVRAIDALSGEIDKCYQQIDTLSFADLFNAITNMQGIQPRNVEEIASRNEEKLTQLGPVIERVANEKLEIAINRAYGIMSRGGLLPPVPESLAEQRIDVEFVSILSQMQRAVGAGQVERGLAFVGNTAAVRPDVLDNVNFDEATREYFERIGMPANALNGEKAVADIRSQRAQEQEAAKSAEMMPAMREGAEAARLLSETNVSGAPLLDQVLGA